MLKSGPILLHQIHQFLAASRKHQLTKNPATAQHAFGKFSVCLHYNVVLHPVGRRPASYIKRCAFFGQIAASSVMSVMLGVQHMQFVFTGNFGTSGIFFMKIYLCKTPGT